MKIYDKLHINAPEALRDKIEPEDVYGGPGDVYAEFMEPWEPWIGPEMLVCGPRSCWDKTFALVAQVSQGAQGWPRAPRDGLCKLSMESGQEASR